MSTSVHRAHVSRTQAQDPLLGEMLCAAAQPLASFARSDKEGRAEAAVRRVDVDPTSSAALWAAPCQWQVTLRAEGSHVEGSVSAVLDDVDRLLAEHAAPDAAREAVVLQAAARDTPLARPLSRHGYFPGTITAIHQLGDGAAQLQHRATATVRPITAADKFRVLKMACDLQTVDASFGTLGDFDDPEPLVSGLVDSLLEGDPELTVVAEEAGEVVGFANLEDPRQAAWIAHSTVLRPAAYLGMAYVKPGHRGGGVGAVLADRLHRIAAARGWAAVLLDYGTLNPFSGPFWAQLGHRPLLVTWMRRPALRSISVNSSV